MTDRIVHLTPSLIDLGEFIQKHVQDGYTLMDAYPRQHGFQYEVIVEKVDYNESDEKTEKQAEDSDTANKQGDEKPKRGRKAAVSEDK